MVLRALKCNPKSSGWSILTRKKQQIAHTFNPEVVEGKHLCSKEGNPPDCVHPVLALPCEICLSEVLEPII